MIRRNKSVALIRITLTEHYVRVTSKADYDVKRWHEVQEQGSQTLHVERVPLWQEQGDWHRVQDRAAQRNWYDTQQHAEDHRVDGDEWPKLTSEMQE